MRPKKQWYALTKLDVVLVAGLMLIGYNPGAAFSDDTGWTRPTIAIASEDEVLNASIACEEFYSGHAQFLCDGAEAQYSGFDFSSIPANSKIYSIYIEYTARQDPDGDCPSGWGGDILFYVQIGKDIDLFSSENFGRYLNEPVVWEDYTVGFRFVGLYKNSDFLIDLEDLDSLRVKMTLRRFTDCDGLGELYGIKVKVIYSPPYTVTYNGNGASGGSPPVDNNIYYPPDSDWWFYDAPQALDPGNLYRLGFNFAGWNTAADGSGFSYNPGDYTYEIMGADITLYAQWESTAPTYYTLTYDGNGNTGGSVPAETAFYEGASVTVPYGVVPFKIPSHFAGWNTAQNGSGIDYYPGQSFSMPAAPVTLYAQWTTEDIYRVTYDGNGNTYGSPPVDYILYQQGDTVTVKTASLRIMGRTGYSFESWNPEADGSGPTIDPGYTFSISGPVTLYAQWTPTETYHVFYDGNGNTGGPAPYDWNSYPIGDTVTVLGPGSLSRTGFSFYNWNTEANNGGAVFHPGDTFSMPRNDFTLYAIWQPLRYTVTYNDNGADSGTPPADQTKTYSVDLTLATNTGGLAKTGYTFNGWNTATDGSGTHYNEGATYTDNAPLALYAEWTESTADTYRVTYDGNGNTGGTPSEDLNLYEEGDTVTVLDPGSLYRTGYTFWHWNVKADDSGISYSPGNTFSMPPVDRTLYAIWLFDYVYTVTYDGNGADSGTPPANQTRTFPDPVTLATNTGGLARTGYTFTGWNTATDGSGIHYNEGETYWGPEDLALYAEWIESTGDTYSVTYNGNGADSGTPPADQAKTHDVDLTLATNTGGLARTGYTFTGWNTATDGSGFHYTEGATYTDNAPLALYAEWTADTYPNLLSWNTSLVADFGDNGLWYHDGSSWNWMTNKGHVSRMVVWDGKLVVDFGADYGLQYYDGISWHWMTNKGEVALMLAWDDGIEEKLVVDFGEDRRMYTYDGSWHWFNNKDAVADMTVWNNKLVVDFGNGRGFYNYDTSWHWMSNKDDIALMLPWYDGNAEKLVVDFGDGRRIYTYDGIWQWFNNKDDVNAMAVWNNKLVVDFGNGRGMYNYDGSWQWMTNKDDVTRFVPWNDGSGEKLAVDFGAGRGMHYYDGSWNWMKNTDDVPEMLAWGNRLAVDFGSGVGIYNYDGSWNWMRNWSTTD